MVSYARVFLCEILKVTSPNARILDSSKMSRGSKLTVPQKYSSGPAEQNVCTVKAVPCVRVHYSASSR